jgi:outer membrane biosynthesis protein TonB
VKHTFKILVLIGFVAIAIGSGTFQPQPGMTVEQVDKQAAASLDIGLVLVGPHPKLSGVMVYETKMQQFQREENRGINPPNPTYYYFLNGRLMSTEAVIQQAAAITSPTPTLRSSASPQSNAPATRQPTTASRSTVTPTSTGSQTAPPMGAYDGERLQAQINQSNANRVSSSGSAFDDARIAREEQAVRDREQKRIMAEKQLQMATAKDNMNAAMSGGTASLESLQTSLQNCITNGLTAYGSKLFPGASVPNSSNVNTKVVLKIKFNNEGDLDVMDVIESSGNPVFDDAAKQMMGFDCARQLRTPSVQALTKTMKDMTVQGFMYPPAMRVRFR